MGIRKEFLTGFILGAAAGFVAAILTAPESGEELRSDLRSRGIELKEQAAKVTTEAQRTAEELQRKAAQAIEEQKQKVEATAAEAQERLQKLAPEVREEAAQEPREGEGSSEESRS